MKITEDEPWWKYKHTPESALAFGFLFWLLSSLFFEITDILGDWYNEIPVSITFLVLVPLGTIIYVAIYAFYIIVRRKI